MGKKQYGLGIEFGSTRIKAVIIDESFRIIDSSEYVWKSSFVDGIWTYSIDKAITGLKTVINGLKPDIDVDALGISGMMHGYLAFDKEWNLLVPFRTWQNTITSEASEKLTKEFEFNIPQRWSIAHFYQAILNREEHVSKVAHITTLAGYIHFLLTGVNMVGVDEASGMFPIDRMTGTYDLKMAEKFNSLVESLNIDILDILPEVGLAGKKAGYLSSSGAALINRSNWEGVPFCPPEGDAGTGMVATNAVKVGTGNISAGTSVFSMIVLNKSLKNVYPEVDVVATPSCDPVAMIHCNNCTNDLNDWVGMLSEAVELFGVKPSTGELFSKLFTVSDEGEKDCGGVISYNYKAGESVTHLNRGCPMLVRTPSSKLSLANFMRTQIYGAIATLKIGMDILKKEDVSIEKISGHGGLFKTPVIGQKYLANALNIPISCMQSSAEGGPYGMALLAMFMLDDRNMSLSEYLDKIVFKENSVQTVFPDEDGVKAFERYIVQYKKGLQLLHLAVETMSSGD